MTFFVFKQLMHHSFSITVIARIDGFFARTFYHVVNLYCKITGKSNYMFSVHMLALAIALLAIECVKYVIDAKYGPCILDIVFGLLGYWGVWMMMHRLKEINEKMEDDPGERLTIEDAKDIIILCLIRCIWMVCAIEFLIIGVYFKQISIIDIRMFVGGLALYAITITNGGGKSLKQKIKEKLENRKLTAIPQGI